MKNLTIFLVIFALAISAKAQPFTLMGDAKDMSNNCIRLTPDIQYSEGLAYYNTKLNLASNFEISFDIYFGDKDEGADGITFVIQNDDRGFEAFGTWGECMGYGRWSKFYEGGNYISPSIAIEFDTYFNERQNDPLHDHIAYLENGTNYHTEYWHNKDENFNLEDDILHDFRFR
ncbi:MAG: lectin, partial [Verrucomicrobia bacterium]|nr:lectin [Cytophagales bacterium]